MWHKLSYESVSVPELKLNNHSENSLKQLLESQALGAQDSEAADNMSLDHLAVLADRTTEYSKQLHITPGSAVL